MVNFYHEYLFPHSLESLIRGFDRVAARFPNESVLLDKCRCLIQHGEFSQAGTAIDSCMMSKARWLLIIIINLKLILIKPHIITFVIGELLLITYK